MFCLLAILAIFKKNYFLDSALTCPPGEVPGMKRHSLKPFYLFSVSCTLSSLSR